MCFRFYSQFLTFPNDVDARAELQTELPGIGSGDWWKAEPLPIHEPNFLFRIYPQVALFDNYPTQISGLQLYSKRLLALLIDGDVHLEWFPACLVDRRTNTVVSEEYAVVNILERYPAIDPDRSTPTRLIFRETFLQQGRQMFRAEENPTRLFVGADLRMVLDRAGITGCLYEPVERLSGPVPVINPRRPRRR